MESYAISRKIVSEMRRIVRHPTVIGELLRVGGKTHILELGVESYLWRGLHVYHHSWHIIDLEKIYAKYILFTYLANIYQTPSGIVLVLWIRC